MWEIPAPGLVEHSTFWLIEVSLTRALLLGWKWNAAWIVVRQ